MQLLLIAVSLLAATTVNGKTSLSFTLNVKASFFFKFMVINIEFCMNPLSTKRRSDVKVTSTTSPRR